MEIPVGDHGGLRFSRITRMEGVTHGAWFLCPGCDEAHVFYLPRWTFDGNRESPTMTPSLLLRRPGHVCHLFLTSGRLQFLSDCTHELAGKTVDLPPIPDWL